MGGKISLHLRILDPRLVPLLDRVGNDRDFFQGVTVEQGGDACASRRVGQFPIGDRADDFVAIGPIGLRWGGERETEKDREKEDFFH